MISFPVENNVYTFYIALFFKILLSTWIFRQICNDTALKCNFHTVKIIDSS